MERLINRCTRLRGENAKRKKRQRRFEREKNTRVINNLRRLKALTLRVDEIFIRSRKPNQRGSFPRFTRIRE